MSYLPYSKTNFHAIGYRGNWPQATDSVSNLLQEIPAELATRSYLSLSQTRQSGIETDFGDLEAEHGGHHEEGGIVEKYFFLTQHVLVSLQHFTPVPETEILLLRVAETRTDKRKFLTGRIIELWPLKFSVLNSFIF